MVAGDGARWMIVGTTPGEVNVGITLGCHREMGCECELDGAIVTESVAIHTRITQRNELDRLLIDGIDQLIDFALTGVPNDIDQGTGRTGGANQRRHALRVGLKRKGRQTETIGSQVRVLKESFQRIRPLVVHSRDPGVVIGEKVPPWVA